MTLSDRGLYWTNIRGLYVCDDDHLHILLTNSIVFPRDARSAKRGIAIVNRLSVRPSV